MTQTTHTCINNTGYPDKDGYGRKQVNGKRHRAHRLAYVQAHGLAIEDIAGQVIRHTCDNRKCINPEHLLIGTPKDNTADMIERGRNLVNGAHFNAVLTKEDVQRIRKVYKPRCPINGAKALAKIYGTGYKNISLIGCNKTWRNV